MLHRRKIAETDKKCVQLEPSLFFFIGDSTIFEIDLTSPIYKNEKNFLSGLRGLLCCEGASVEFRQCDAGGGEKGDRFGQILADKLGTKTILYQGSVTPYGGSGSLFDHYFKRKIFVPRQNNQETNQ